MARDLAEIAGDAAIAFPPEMDRRDPIAGSVMARERIVFATHRSLLAEQLHVIDERIAQAREQQDGAAAQHLSAMRGLGFGTQQLQALMSLEREGLAGRNTVLELSRSVEALRGGSRPAGI